MIAYYYFGFVINFNQIQCQICFALNSFAKILNFQVPYKLADFM